MDYPYISIENYFMSYMDGGAQQLCTEGMTVVQASLRCKHLSELSEPLDENPIVETSMEFLQSFTR
jgi:hypothetical protein